MSAVAAIRKQIAPPAPPVELRADPVERLVTSAAAPRFGERARLLALFAAFLLVHGALLTLFLVLAPDEPVPPEQEIVVEVVPPPEQQAPPEPPPPEPEQPQPKEEAKQQPPPPLDLKPAFDAPRAPTPETIEREAADKETAAPKVAPPPTEAAANKPEPNTQPENKGATAPTQAPAAERAALDKPDAEAIERAETKPDNPQPTSSPDKPAPPSAGMPMFLQQLANLKPIPDYKLSAAAPPSPAPASTGTAQDNYLSRLYAIVMPRYRQLKGPAGKVRGRIVFVIDTAGYILHVGLVQPSGSREVDNAALAALRSSTPFPPPPRGLPSLTFQYD